MSQLQEPLSGLEFMQTVFLGLSDLLESRSIGGCFPLHLQLIAQPLWLLGCPPPMPPPAMHLHTHCAPAYPPFLPCSPGASELQSG